MLSAHSYLIYIALYAIYIAVPGPGVVAMVARALGSGFRAAIPAAAAAVFGEWVWMTLTVFGLSAVAQTMGNSFLIVKYAGALYLIYLGYKHWTAEVSDIPDTSTASARQSFFAQLTVILGNPKAMAFFLALLPTLVDLKHINSVGYLQLSLVTLVVTPAITLTYSALAAQMRKFLTSRRARKGINRTAAVIMVGAGAGVATT